MSAAPNWLTVVIFAVPLMTLAGSAFAYVVSLFQGAAERRNKYFFDLMEYIDSNRPIATKVAAIYELRRFKKHKEFIIRFCDTQGPLVSGTGAGPLQDEMKRTRDYLSK